MQVVVACLGILLLMVAIVVYRGGGGLFGNFIGGGSGCGVIEVHIMDLTRW